AGTNHGTLVGNVVYASGEVDQGFVLDGTNSAVRVGLAPSLQVQDFTIESWIQRASTNLVTGSPANNALVFAFGSGGYGLGLDFSGHPMLTRVDKDQLSASAAITDTEFHHVAITKSGTTIIFYIDGAAYPVSSYGGTFTFNTIAAVGARGDTLFNSFL